MIKILYTTSFADAIGGGQVGLLLLLERLNRERFQPLLLVPEGGEVAERARRLGCDVRIFALPPLRSGWPVISALRRLRRLLKEEGVSIIHTDDPRSALYSMIAKFGLGIALILHIRTMIGDILDPILERGVDRLILVARSVSGRFSETGQRKSVVVYNGIDPKDIPAIAPASLPARRSPLLICPARLHEPKGQHVLLQALYPLKGEFPTMAVWFVGRGEEEYIRRLKLEAAEYGLDHCVEFLGYRPDLRALYPLADLVVLPTFHEAFPRVLLEAMSAGRAVVASDVGGVAEAVLDGETGILVPAGDSGRLSAAVGELLRDKPKRERMGEAGRRQVDRFSVGAMVGSIEKLYGELHGA